ncbi:TetR/AcrR family transcriptional regulator [Nocardioides sp.]|uniref:TetR/AcrR family transcriptional regulator n=1 Tax=Nocardioides sp. TaxID=35761 RepID=UPI003527FB49
MGLREINAERTRQLIVEAAMELFFTRGYDETTMEDVAAHAGIGNSTLYRYFPTKDQLGSSLLGDPGLMAEELASRPVDEPIEQALGRALLAFLQTRSEDRQRGESFRQLLSDNPRLGMRVVEWLMETHDLLSAAVAARQGREPGDLSSRAAAWSAVFVLQEVGPPPTPATPATGWSSRAR